VTATSRLACISVDLDSLQHYCRIHGLPEELLDDRARALVYTLAVPRFLELIAEQRVPATFFAIGEDLTDARCARALAQAQERGVEVGNHSLRHDYALSRASPGEIAAEIEAGAQAIRRATGRLPVGFRAPGYTLSAALYQEVEKAGYLYDSSVFPAAPYYLAKAGVMAALAAAGRPSRAILDSPRVLAAPLAAYWPDPAQPYRRGGGRTLELPITVEPRSRIPFIGTMAVAFPRPLVRALYAATRGVELFNFELHAVDVLGAGDGLPAALLGRQRDLRVPAEDKCARLREIFGWLRRDFEVVTLAQAAGRR
jgi:peptidoglycan/xylan/chitin deacetylase (PgdA/CDA1 family)